MPMTNIGLYYGCFPTLRLCVRMADLASAFFAMRGD
jgi:hypothetical protein